MAGVAKPIEEVTDEDENDLMTDEEREVRWPSSDRTRGTDARPTPRFSVRCEREHPSSHLSTRKSMSTQSYNHITSDMHLRIVSHTVMSYIHT